MNPGMGSVIQRRRSIRSHKQIPAMKAVKKNYRVQELLLSSECFSSLIKYAAGSARF